MDADERGKTLINPIKIGVIGVNLRPAEERAETAVPWDFKTALWMADALAELDVYQPDVVWSMGILRARQLAAEVQAAGGIYSPRLHSAPTHRTNCPRPTHPLRCPRFRRGD